MRPSAAARRRGATPPRSRFGPPLGSSCSSPPSPPQLLSSLSPRTPPSSSATILATRPALVIAWPRPSRFPFPIPKQAHLDPGLLLALQKQAPSAPPRRAQFQRPPSPAVPRPGVPELVAGSALVSRSSAPAPAPLAAPRRRVPPSAFPSPGLHTHPRRVRFWPVDPLVRGDTAPGARLPVGGPPPGAFRPPCTDRRRAALRFPIASAPAG